MSQQGYDAHLKRAEATRGVRGRYAPSPTGPLHMGNIRTALLAWLQVRLMNGRLVLRIEDLDLPRVRAESIPTILKDLEWLGLDWDEGPSGPFQPYSQSERFHFYEEALRRLGPKVFRCYCSRKDLQSAASAPHGGGPVYPGICRDLTPGQRDAVQAARPERLPAWRYRVDGKRVAFEDRVLSRYSQDLATELGDFVLKRADGLFAYQLAVVVDDALMGITDVLRGEDLLSSTPRQIELFGELGYRVPRFWHVPLLRDANGERLAKRNRAQSVAFLREQGEPPERIIGRLAASLGFVREGSALSAEDLLKELDAETFREMLRR